MGELAKKIGEQGEKIVLNFFDLIGWENTSYAIDLPCVFNNKHKHNGKEKRKEHGIDGLFHYETPLFDDLLEHIIISVKFSKNNYSQYPNSDFKSHFKDLATAIECYDKSNLKNEYNEEYGGLNTETKGLLIWIHNKDCNESIVDKIMKAQIDNTLSYNSIYILDNNRVSFIDTSIKLVKNKYTNHIIKFHYIDTGHNLSIIKRQYDGDILPIQMLFNDIQLFKLEEKHTQLVTLAMIVKDKFEKDSLEKIIGLSYNLSKNFTKVDIYFPDYDTLHNSNIVSDIKRKFKDKEFTKKIKIYSFENRFQNLGD